MIIKTKFDILEVVKIKELDLIGTVVGLFLIDPKLIQYQVRYF